MENEISSRRDDVVVQENRQRDDDVVHEERQHQSEEDVEPSSSKRARIEKLFGLDLGFFYDNEKVRIILKLFACNANNLHRMKSIFRCSTLSLFRLSIGSSVGKKVSTTNTESGEVKEVCTSDDDSVQGEKPYVMQNHLSEEEEEGEFNASNIEEVAETLFDDIAELPKSYSGNSKQKQSEDPFGLDDVLAKNKKVMEKCVVSPSLSHPPGFTPVGLETTNANDQVIEEVKNRADEDASSLLGGLGNKTKKEWIKELTTKHKLNLIAIQETKMDKISHMDVKFMWGNSNFDFVCNESLGNSSGILCIWETSVFKKDHVSISNNFIAIYGTWLSNKVKFLFIVVFISSLCLVDVKLEGYSFTWSHSSGSKMSKLDRFLVTEGVASIFPFISAIYLDRHLSDHRPILLRDNPLDFGPIPFRWAIEGDENSKFFHGIINKKRSQLAIRGILVYGVWLNDPFAVKEAFKNHFEVEDLERGVSRDEIRDAVWSCGDSKSPGPDGYTFEFFKKYWRFVGPDFCEAVEQFFSSGAFSKGCNSSFIALIPKVMVAKLVSDFRPISLIGCVYKVVTKIMASRLASVISDIISDTQSAFVSERQILDGPFIINEILHWCKMKNKQAMFFKVDFAFCYAKASVLVNGSPSN
nr:RNA-directed DNA polymerase, eukaryota, reverse transcriptase zinc-binding domain protein [Tanacetum cinerariifolium]